MGENGHKGLTAIKRNVKGFLHGKSTLNGRNTEGSLMGNTFFACGKKMLDVLCLEQ
jgi:hypothetical protein